MTFEELQKRSGYTADLIFLTLDELKRQDLIQADYASPFTGMSRREVVKKVGLASMIALPLISNLTAPKAAQAASSNLPPTTCSGTCIPAGADLCGNRSGQTITYRAHPDSSDGRCTGRTTRNVTYFCETGVSVSSGFDICRD